MQNFYLAISIHLVKLCAYNIAMQKFVSNLFFLFFFFVSNLLRTFNLAIYCEAFNLAIFYKYSAMEEFVCNLCQTFF
jgi:hypothetical protein